jgi:hypothetical protein
MERDLDTQFVTTIPAADSPDSKWIAWAVWSGLSLILVLLAVFGAGFDTGLLLGWAVGTIIAAMLMVFRR